MSKCHGELVPSLTRAVGELALPLSWAFRESWSRWHGHRRAVWLPPKPTSRVWSWSTPKSTPPVLRATLYPIASESTKQSQHFIRLRNCLPTPSQTSGGSIHVCANHYSFNGSRWVLCRYAMLSPCTVPSSLVLCLANSHCHETFHSSEITRLWLYSPYTVCCGLVLRGSSRQSFSG